MDNEKRTKFIEKQLISINKIFEIYEKINKLDKSLEQLYPIAIIEDNDFFVFDLNSSGKQYEYKMNFHSEMNLPNEILAAFPLEGYEWKMAAVVTPKAFDDIEGIAFIFHEFVHCFQYYHYEMEIKETLTIAKEAKEKHDFMWELNYPFPYDNEEFIRKTMELNNGYDIRKYHIEMKAILNDKEFEYMIWQEWKEGYARYIENMIREKIGLKKNNKILKPPFDRVCFYETGSNYINDLIKRDMELKNNLEKIFFRINKCQ
ncbi:MAG: hypothetical protein FWE09_07090 [Treponema sp.]|nr:hypothetical protein [Treponema sp.]